MSAPTTGHEPTLRPTAVADRYATAQSIRIAAVGDLHATTQTGGKFRPGLLCAAAEADILLLAGDLTNNGQPEEARCVADELRDLGVVTAATLGNHDHHHGCPDEVAAILAGAGVQMLEGAGIVLTIRGMRLGIAGVKGFGGGFPGAILHEFGEPQMKAFVSHARGSAEALEAALTELEADVRVAVTHYAPVPDTLAGEPLGLRPVLGSHLLDQAIDRSGATLAVHGHAHHGKELGATPGGVQVRNVARQVIQAPYALYTIAMPPPVRRKGRHTGDCASHRAH
jgi:Icc-related predicted phosphoesterase